RLALSVLLSSEVIELMFWQKLAFVVDCFVGREGELVAGFFVDVGVVVLVVVRYLLLVVRVVLDLHDDVRLLRDDVGVAVLVVVHV
ncbi:hypothetical protein AAHH78_35315, partial [Burkholderia pseudomallei]